MRTLLSLTHLSLTQARHTLTRRPDSVALEHDPAAKATDLPSASVDDDAGLQADNGARNRVTGTDRLCAGGLEGYAEGVDPWFVP